MITLKHEHGAPPLYRQIYQQLQQQILSGELSAGTRLMASREQAVSLGVSRNTVDIAYQQLCAEGYLSSRVGSGYYVQQVPILEPSAEIVQQTSEADADEQNLPLEYGRFCPERFPLAAFQKAQNHALQEAAFCTYCPPGGLPELQKQLQKYLQRSRGVQCQPEQIVIGSGTQALIDLICQLLRRFCGEVRPAMEDPGYDGVRYALENNGLRPIPLPVEEDGICVQAVRDSRANLVYLTPSHQFPTGAVLPIQKRLQLIQWAQETEAFLLEDDYDSEFRYASLPIPSMQSLWPSGQVLYLGTMSKILSPALRLSYLVLPPELLAVYRTYYASYHCPVATFTQQALTILMEKGQWDLHLHRLVQYNRRLHDALAKVLEIGENRLFTLSGKGAGLHFVLRPLSDLTETELLSRGASLGLKLYPLSPYYQTEQTDSGIVVGFGSLTPEQIPEIGEKLLMIFQK